VARDAAGRVVGEAAPLDADAPPWADPLFGFELVLDPSPRQHPRYTPLPTTPAVERVLALLLPDGVRAGAVESVLRTAGGALLEQVRVDSDYRSPELPPGTRSVAFGLTFRVPDRTLRDAEVDAVETRLLAALDRELGVRRRDAGGSPAGE
jgi:phenylalanyl-tRNA synthetase beta subunit